MNFSKGFIFFILLISGCSYGSYYEANISCNEWKEKGGKYKGIIQAIKKTDLNKNYPEYLLKDTENTFSLRRCQPDKETNQILGFNVINREENKKYYFPENQRVKGSVNNILDINLKLEIIKRFKY